MYEGSKTLHDSSKTRIKSFLGHNGELNTKMMLNLNIDEKSIDGNNIVVKGNGVLKHGSKALPFKGMGNLRVEYVNGNPVYVGPLHAKFNKDQIPVNLGIHYYPAKDKLFVTTVINEIGNDTIRMHFGTPFGEASKVVNNLSIESTNNKGVDRLVMNQPITTVTTANIDPDYTERANQNNEYIKTVVASNDYSPTSGNLYTTIANVYSKNSAVRTWWENHYDYPGATEVINSIGESEVNIKIHYSDSWNADVNLASPNNSSVSVSVPVFLPSGVQTFSLSIDEVIKDVDDNTNTATWEYSSPNIGTTPASGKFFPSKNNNNNFTVYVDTDINYAVYIDLYNMDWNPLSIVEYQFASNPTVSFTVN